MRPFHEPLRSFHFGRLAVLRNHPGQSGHPPTTANPGVSTNGVSSGNDYAGVGPGAGNQYWIQTARQLCPTSLAAVQTSGLKQVPLSLRQRVHLPHVVRVTTSTGPDSTALAQLCRSRCTSSRHENHALVFKAEAFNYLNHPIWTIRMLPHQRNFGQVVLKGTTYSSDASVQFSLRYAF